MIIKLERILNGVEGAMRKAERHNRRKQKVDSSHRKAHEREKMTESEKQTLINYLRRKARSTRLKER